MKAIVKENNVIENDINKTALKAGFWYVVSTIVVKSLIVLTTPIFTRILNTEEYGIVSMFNSWYSLFLVFCTLNLNYSIGRAKLDYKNKLDKYIGSMCVLSLFVTIAFSIVLVLIYFIDNKSFEMPWTAVMLLIMHLLFAPAIVFYQNGCKYRYRYKENIFITIFITSSSIIISLLLIAIINKNNVLLRMIGIVFPYAVIAIYIWKKLINNHLVSINKEYWKYGLRLSLPLVLHVISLNILSQSDRVIISKYCSMSDVAVYSLSYSYGMLISIITNAIAEGWLPWFHDKYYVNAFEEIREKAKLIITLGCFLCIGCVLIAPEAIYILGGENYKKGVYCVVPIALGVLCQYLYTHYVNIELHLKKTQYVPFGTIIAAVINIILNIIFIPIYGFIAAAYTTLFSYIVLMGMHYLITKLILKVKLYDDIFLLLSYIIVVIISFFLMQLYEYIVIRFILVVILVCSFLLTYRKYLNNYIRNYIKSKHK